MNPNFNFKSGPTLQIKKVIFGSGKPKICLPLTGTNDKEIIVQIEKLLTLPFDLIEWRMDFYDHILDDSKTLAILNLIRKYLKDTPLLASFRTKKEGGQKDLMPSAYVSLLEKVIATHLIDLIDIELFTGHKEVSDLVHFAHEHQIAVVMSSHEFSHTPPKQEMLHRLTLMQNLKADLPKLAVMPKSPGDVLNLLSVTYEMTSQYATCPIITMAMGDLGKISRLSGELFGSCLTFGSGEVASAPGQVPATELSPVLELLSLSTL